MATDIKFRYPRDVKFRYPCGVKFRYPCRAWEGTWEELPIRSTKYAMTWGFATRSGPLTSTQPLLAVDGFLFCRGGGFWDG